MAMAGIVRLLAQTGSGILGHQGQPDFDRQHRRLKDFALQHHGQRLIHA
jgi:hypothetical protein